MNQIPRLPADERGQVFAEAGAELGLPAFYVEKDFWVCWVLEVLFKNERIGEHLTFRGGTSLSKGWGLIDRFSEDIDLGISRQWVDPELLDIEEQSISKAKRHSLLKRLRSACREAVREEVFPLLDAEADKLGDGAQARLVGIDQARDPFIIEFEYPRVDLEVTGDYHRHLLKLEFSGRADSWPQADRPIGPYVAEVFPLLGPWHPVEIACVTPVRTFWEKASLLHEKHVQGDQANLGRQARHLYDLVRLWEHVQEDAKLMELFDAVKLHRKAFFNYGGVDYDQLTPGGLMLVPPEQQLGAWRTDYRDMKEMFIGDPPEFDALIESISQIENALRASA